MRVVRGLNIGVQGGELLKTSAPYTGMQQSLFEMLQLLHIFTLLVAVGEATAFLRFPCSQLVTERFDP